MSQVIDWRRCRTIGALLTVFVLSSATSGTGQYYPQVTTYVCQTPTFWCAFQWTPGFPNGTSCYCNTVWGPVWGSSINPAGVPNPPKLPKPQNPQNPQNPTTPPERTEPGDVEPDDCYKGLGNCPGSFMRAAKGGSSPPNEATSDRSEAPASEFGNALQELIDAAEDDFDDVRGEERRSSGGTDRYETTVVPEGMERCTLFVPQSAERAPFVSCFAPDGMSRAQLVRLVANALGSGGSREGEYQKWQVDDVEVAVSGRSTLRIRRSRN